MKKKNRQEGMGLVGQLQGTGWDRAFSDARLSDKGQQDAEQLVGLPTSAFTHPRSLKWLLCATLQVLWVL